MKYDAIVVAAGKGVRSGLNYNKTFFVMDNNLTVLENSCKLFLQDEDCNKVIVVTNREFFDKVFIHEKVVVVEGGQTRKDSVYNGLKHADSEYVFIHDGARPYFDINSLKMLKEKVVEKGNVILASKSIDTVKIVNEDKIEKTVDRNNVYLAQTPQCFKTEMIKYCYEHCEDISFSDDASLVESMGYDVYVVNNEHDNRKLTYKDDFK